MEKTRKILTLCLIHDHPRILLGMKKRGFGQGRWNGFGGKLKAGESIEDAAKREILEESGLIAHDLEKFGVIDFEFTTNQEEILEVHIFRVLKYEGEPTESEEMKPAWFHPDEIPFAEMWPDDIHWFPMFLRGSKFRGRFLFGEEDVVLEKELVEVPEL